MKERGMNAFYAHERPCRRLSLLILAVLVTALALGGAAYARYALRSEQTKLAEAAGFYASSDLLSVGGETRDLYNGSAPFAVRVFNHENGSASQLDVSYTVSVENGTADVSAGVIPTGAAEALITVTPAAGAQTVTVTVTTAPYAKTMRATFRLHSAGAGSYYALTDNGSFCTLTIRTGQTDCSPVVSWSAALAPDNTDPLMADWTGGSGSLSLPQNAVCTLIFFENTAGSYSVGDTPFTGSITLP